MNDLASEKTVINDDPHAAGEEHPLGHLGQAVGFAVFLAVWVIDSFVLRLSSALAGPVSPAVRLPAAGLILALAVYLNLKGHAAVHAGPDRPRALIREGVFARVRHPLYLGSILFYLGLAVSTLSLLSLAVCGGIFAFFDRIASYEETRLVQRYGAAYRDYRGRVPKWVPRLLAARFDPSAPE